MSIDENRDLPADSRYALLVVLVASLAFLLCDRLELFTPDRLE
jgi:hypothetical protein